MVLPQRDSISNRWCATISGNTGTGPVPDLVGSADAVWNGTAQFGVANDSWAFRGSEYLQAPNSGIPFNAERLSFSFWYFNNSAQTSGAGAMSKAQAANSGEWYGFLSGDPNSVTLRVTDDSGSNRKGRVTDGTYAMNTWHNVCCSIERTATNTWNLGINVDGVTQTTSESSLNNVDFMVDSGTDVYIGSRGSSSLFYGNMDDCIIWPGVYLTPTERTQVHTEDRGGDPTAGQSPPASSACHPLSGASHPLARPGKLL